MAAASARRPARAGNLLLSTCFLSLAMLALLAALQPGDSAPTGKHKSARDRGEPIRARPLPASVEAGAGTDPDPDTDTHAPALQAATTCSSTTKRASRSGRTSPV